MASRAAIGAERLVGVPTDRHVLHGGDELGASVAVNLAESDFPPNRVGYFRGEESRGVKFLPPFDETTCVS